MMTRRATTAACALALLLGGWAHAADYLLPGRKLSMTIRVGRERVVFLANDPAVVAPTPQGADDPTSVGARLLILNPISGESASFDLPARRVTDPLGLELGDPIVFLGIAKRPAGSPTDTLVQGNQVRPFRGYGAFDDELIGGTTLLGAGDEVRLLIHARSCRGTLARVPTSQRRSTSRPW